MVIPNVPEESEVKNIIDKLANFVARNGLEFENMTKNKQKNNPKFSFLFGGKYFAYYKYKLASEQQMLNPQNSNLPDVSSHSNQWNQMNFTPFNQAPAMNNLPVIPPWQQQPPPNFLPSNQPPIPPNPSVNIPPRPFMMTSHPVMSNDQLDDEEFMKQQIRESEMNLQQQYESLTAQEEARVDEIIYELDEKDGLQHAGEAGINLNQLDHLLQPVIDSCTKDSIASCKQWILNNSISPFHSSIICKLILNRVVTASRKARKQRQDVNMNLHLVYLLHDVIHHAARRNIDHLMMAIEHVITPIYCITFINSEGLDRDKLSKLLDLWEEQKYFQIKIVNGIRRPENTLNEYQMERSSFHAETIRNIKHEFQSKFEKYKHQHQEYCDHLQLQINEKRQFFDNRRLPNKPLPMRDHFNESADNNFQGDGPAKFQPPLNEPWMTSSSRIDRPHDNFPPRQDYAEPQQPDFAPTAPSGGSKNVQKSPPTAPIAPVTSSDEALKPKAPYYDLPAGLMAPLVPLSEMEYKELDPDLIRFPPPLPPNDRLLAAVEAFYLPPSHGYPRNADGWETNGLFEFFRAKTRAKRALEQRQRRSSSISSKSSTSRSRSNSPIPRSRDNISPPSRRRSKSRDVTPPRSRGFSPPKQLNEGWNNRGAAMMKKMGWSGAGLGSKEQGAQEPVHASSVRDNFDKFKGLGNDLKDPYESYRKSRSQGYISRIRSNKGAE